jgi:SAM-dependent methyltransferase
VLTEPEFEACLASRRLFDFPVVQARFPLPFAPASFEAIWSLGVLCTVDDQGGFLRELRRVLTARGRLGLLVFVATRDQLSDQPAGNQFPTVDGLRRLLDDAGFRVGDSATLAEFAETSNAWQERVDAVEAELVRRHGSDPAWRTAAEQSALIGRLLADEELVGSMIVTRPESD